MQDMLVKLYELENDWSFIKEQENNGFSIRKPIGPEIKFIIDWVTERFGEGWGSEVSISLSNTPKSCFIAMQSNRLVGFACYDATALGLFGPTGIDESFRGKGIGTALLFACLLDMKLKGYQYAVIGGVGPTQFYEKTVGAKIIEGSSPGFYKEILKKNTQ